METMEHLRGVPVLVTGGAGFVGAHLAHALHSHGAIVTVLDIKPEIPRIAGHYDELRSGVRYVSGSVADASVVDPLIREGNFGAIFHLAAEAIVQVFHADPVRGLESNIQGTWVLLDAIRRFAPATPIVIASSDKAYGSHDTLPYDETHALQGRNPYDCSKSCTDLVAHMYSHSYGLKLLVTRCGNIYGGGDLNFSRIIPDTIRLVHAGKAPVLRSDGKFLRDFVHVDDAVSAYVRAATALHEGHPSGDAYNFGQNEPMYMIDVVKRILTHMGAEHLQPVIQNVAKFEIRDQYLDAKKAMERLKWTPSVSFDDGLKRTIAWYIPFLDRYPQYVTS